MKLSDEDVVLKALAGKVIATRVGEFAPLVQKWQQEHPRVPMARLVEDGLKLVLKKYAGKRHAHLVGEAAPATEMGAQSQQLAAEGQLKRNLRPDLTKVKLGQITVENGAVVRKGKVAA